MFQTAQITEAYGTRGQDRVAVIEHPAGIVAVVADGAGGTSGGAEAADTLLLWVRAYADRATDLGDPFQWAALLERVDRQIAAANGQTTAVVVAATRDGLCGASVGDSAAWLIPDGNANAYDNLTANQARKPLLGSGSARPVAFERPSGDHTLLLASDGLVKYAPPHRICGIARDRDLTSATRRLVDAVRLKSGALQDDVGLVLLRRRPAAPEYASRKRFALTDDGEIVETGD